MFEPISEYFELILSKFQCGLRKGFSTQLFLLAMLEKCKSPVDNKKTNFGTLLTDLSKTFSCLSHDLLLAKLNAYGLSLVLILVHGLSLVLILVQNWGLFHLVSFYVIYFP